MADKRWKLLCKELTEVKEEGKHVQKDMSVLRAQICKRLRPVKIMSILIGNPRNLNGTTDDTLGTSMFKGVNI